MGCEQMPGVEIYGQIFSYTDAVCYILAGSAIKASGHGSYDNSSDKRAPTDPDRMEEDIRFTPIESVVDELENRIGYEEGLKWLTTPNRNGVRPLDIMGTDQWPLILEHVRKIDFPKEF